MQLAVKQAAFACQQMTRGVIDTSPLKNMVYEHKGSKQYIIEQPRVAADGTPISSGRIIKAEDYSQATKGIARLDENGKVIYQACFAAGTLVHTEQGPLPIEKVRPGTRVLSQPENGGETAYKPVINTVAHLDQQVHAVQVKVEGSDELTTLITTPNHPFWVQERLVHDQHWLAAECLEPGMVLQIAGGGAGANAGEHIAPSLVATRYATVYANGLIRHTQHAHIGFAADDRVGVGMVLDLTDPKHVHLVKPEQASELGSLQLGQPFLTPVYNFSVDEFHTYYVGNSAVWVHNSCGPEGAVDAVAEKAAIEGECFSGDTYVVVEPWTDNFNGGVKTDKLYIERIEVGDTVLSRCELTDEMAYKQVTKVFAHGFAKTSLVVIEFGPEFYEKHGKDYNSNVLTTANHPFWVQGKGWTKVCDLQPGDELLTSYGFKATVKEVNLGVGRSEVYNLEVEDFHTYFVESPGIWVHNKSPLKFDRLNPNVVPDPKPQWMPLHDSEVVLVQRKATLEQRKAELNAITTRTPAENLDLKDVNRELTETNTALQEIPVGDAAVWVHNTGCTKDAPIDFVLRKVERDGPKPTCFPMDTLVVMEGGLWAEIDRLSVGTKVLSRSEKTGEQAYKRITKKFEHSLDEWGEVKVPTYEITFVTSEGKEHGVEVTAEHSFWVNGVGWVPAIELQPGQMLEICDPLGIDDCDRPEGQKVEDVILSGQRWQAEVVSVSKSVGACVVYNIEVEDFHTYFVGPFGVWVHNTKEVGKVIYQACFAAGTLVHTEQGPLPIEKVRPGTRVLSQPENGGETAYKPVINTVAHLDQQVHAVQIKVEGCDELTTLITTPNHPFWVQKRLVHDQHWLAAECLEPGMVLQISDGRLATVYANGLIRHTQHANMGFAADDRVGVGMVLDLTDPKRVQLLDPAQTDGLGMLELGEPLLTPVYNFSVDEFHTYYVGNSAVWVHNTCDGTRAVDAVAEKAAIEGECFSGETFVVVEPWEYKRGVTKFVTDKLYIERIEVGDTVLSRCETTGEMAYKQVTKVFSHGWRTTSDILFDCAPEFHQKYPNINPIGFTTTANHPFWVQDKGWTKVCDLQPGDEMLTYDGIKATVKQVDLNISGEDVYNLEVEDFHTYFVGSPGIWVHNKSPLKFDRLNPNVVPDPKPQWTPQHKGEAALIQRKATLEQRKAELNAITTRTPAENLELKDVNRGLTETTAALQEIYVGDAAVWVHNTNCRKKDAVDAVFEKAVIEGECFSGDTLVMVEPWENSWGKNTDVLRIERVEVGDTVLSRCELTGEMAYKQVTKVFAHGWRTTSSILFECGPEFYEKYPTMNPPGITTTENHPFWVQSKGWTKVRDLQPGDEMFTYDGIKATVKHVSLNNSGEDVYNLEVEDFHTYFVESPGIWVHNKSPLKFDRLNPNVVPDPKPQWTPLHDSEVVLVQRKATLEQRKAELNAITTRTPAENLDLKDVNRELTETNTALQEIYVGDAAVWVHNSGCPKETALATVAEKIVSLDKGKVEGSQFCFAAGTLVHTKNGLVPIEQINVGDWVLSRHDNNTGKQAYKRVLKTIQSDETKPIIMLRYYSELDEKICQLYVTNEHPIFVRSQSGRDIGWEAAHTIAHPDKLVSFDGTPIEAFENCTLWVTPNHGVAWGQSRVHDYGPLVDFNGSAPTILEGRTSEEAMGGMFAEFKAIVYNLEVEDFHTYYVGELGIWVHNTSSEQKAVLEQRKSELNAITTKTPAEVKELKDVNRGLTETNTALQEIQPRKAQGRVINRIRSCDL